MEKFFINGTPIAFASDCKLVAEEPKAEWVDADSIAKSWDVSCEAPVECGDIVMKLLGGEPKYDVVFELPIGKLPRKMKKAWKVTPFNKNTKWQRKVMAYMKTRKKLFKDCTIDFAPAENGINATITPQS